VTRIGRYSPETFEAEWIEGSTEPAVGARFRGHVKRNEKGPIYWTKCTVIDCTPGESFSFGVGAPGNALSIWGYELKPSGDGTDITESFTLAEKAPLRLYWALFSRWRGKRNRTDMLRTLEKVKADAESS
jgi:hypothetical protein